MAYKCPQCGQPVKRGHSSKAQIGAGLVGVLFYAAFGSFECEGCGKITRSEFPPEVRRKMAVGSISLAIGAIVLLVFVIWLVFAMDW